MKHFKHILQSLHRPRVLMAVALIVLMVPNVILTFTETLTFAGMTVNILLPLGFYWLFLSLSPNVGRQVWLLFPVIFIAAFQLVLLSLYGRSVIAVDMFLNLTTTNPGEAGELLSNMWPTVLVVVALYVPPLVAGVLIWRKGMMLSATELRGSRRCGAVLTGLGVLALAVAVNGDTYTVRNDLYPVNVGYNISLAVNHSVKLRHYDELSRDFTFDAVALHPETLPEVYVLIVGETSRADHWQLNGYERPTTPMLAGVHTGNVHSFPRAISQSNTTHKSVPLLLSHLTPENYGDSIYSVKSIITAFKEAGFATAFVSCQQRNGSFIDFFGSEADTTIFLRDANPGVNDMDLARTLDALMRNRGRKQLYVLHCYGSHFNYRDRYPATYARFKPDGYAEAVAGNREELVNAYDNTIAMTDRMLDYILLGLQKQPGVAAMVYTSDHGEDIFDDDRGLFLHASPCPSFYQLHVPFVVWVSDSYRAFNPTAASLLERNVNARIASNDSFFNTALDLAGISTPKADLTASVASMKFREHPRCYLNDHNRGVELSRCGFTEADNAMLSRLDYR